MFLWIMDMIFTTRINNCSVIYSVLLRGVSSLLLAFFVFLSIGNYIITRLHVFRFFQIIRSCGPASHVVKKNTPTMGGVIILLSVTISVIMWSDLSNLYVWHVLCIFLAYGILGLIDDLYKIKRKNADGLQVLYKYFWQSFIALVSIFFIFICKYNFLHINSFELCFKKLIFQLDFWSILLAYFVLVGTSNAVNLSDGLDGLAVVPVVLILSGLAIIAWASSSVYYSNHLNILYISDVKELIIVCAAIIGSGLGFLWFNAYPAQIFMGDTGSLAFGGAIGLITILLHQEFLLLIMGGLFVIESFSVILQVSFFKFFKKRIFKMAPIHHHFELKGYLEPKIVVRFWILSFILVCLSLVIFMVKK